MSRDELALRLGGEPGDCGKYCFSRRWNARIYRKALIKAGTRDPAIDWRLSEYWCGRCHAYHVGHVWTPEGCGPQSVVATA